VALANQTLTEVRRRVTRAGPRSARTQGNREWELRNRLTRSAARMRGEHVDALLDELSNLPEAIATPITSTPTNFEEPVYGAGLMLLPVPRHRTDTR
jgi:hypothetical protein